MKLLKENFGFLLAAVLLVLGFVVKAMPGYSFSALILWGMSAVAVCYQLLHILGKKREKPAKILCICLTACLCVGILTAAVTGSFIIRGAYGTPGQYCDYVIVLGAGVNGSVPSLSLQERIDAAYEYLVAHPQAICIVSGGKGADEPMTEAAAMYEELVALGIEPERIWMEDKATSTWENLNFSLDLIEANTGQRPTKLAILSSEYHLFRASLFAKECGVEFVGIPAKTSRMGQTINHFMREVAGVWHFWLLDSRYQ